MAAEKKERVSQIVEMQDGSKVEFVGKQRMLKTTLIDESKIALDGDTLTVEAGAVSVRLDFVNGETRTWDIPLGLFCKTAGHGGGQKTGDEAAGVESLDDAILAIDNLIEQLNAGQWSMKREKGGFAGAAVIVRALMEVTGKDQAFVKKYIEDRLAAAEARGEELSRQALYKGFRVLPEINEVIVRIEAAEAAKSTKVDAAAELAALRS